MSTGGANGRFVWALVHTCHGSGAASFGARESRFRKKKRIVWWQCARQDATRADGSATRLAICAKAGQERGESSGAAQAGHCTPSIFFMDSSEERPHTASCQGKRSAATTKTRPNDQRKTTNVSPRPQAPLRKAHVPCVARGAGLD